MYQISRVKKIGLMREYKGQKSAIEEQVLAIKVGTVHTYQDVFFKECRYSYFPILVGIQEKISIDTIVGIESFCTDKELQEGKIATERLIEIYNQINLPEYAISVEQLKLIKKTSKKYGDI